MKLGIDAGSTTVKLILLNDNNEILFKRYERHMSSVFDKAKEMLVELANEYGNISVRCVVTGSGGMNLAEQLGVNFRQEVVTCTEAVKKLIPETDVVIELGGEDAKITYFGASVEQRMNGTCAGGTGAFIDQIAALLDMDSSGINEAAERSTAVYPIAARCGVFAKTDIQPLLNEGAPVENIAASVLQAVVNQTISGLACGRRIRGKVAFLGGPLTYMPQLRKRFVDTLQLKDDEVIFPDNANYFVALGASFMAEKEESTDIEKLLLNLESDFKGHSETRYLEPLFANEEEYEKFKARHESTKVAKGDLASAEGALFLGIDAGSTTTKAALIDSEGSLLYSFYKGNHGNPLMAVREMLSELYSQLPQKAYISKSTVTGYGEQLIKTGFKVDYGIIETMAHYKGAAKFLPGVDFILDIGGQDMKCMRIKDGAIYSIMLNEACSSGCGSFIETFAGSVNMSVEEFGKVGLHSQNPIDLGSRCTVFMNSMVKQAQKEGASMGDIASGLSYSVIKNALYKVIKLRNPEEAGNKIVVQGGTFLNPSVLRAIEKVLGREVVCPDIAGLMGAYGAALNSLENSMPGDISQIISESGLNEFSFENKNARCGGCGNNCMLTITKFADGSSFITGNRCEKGANNMDEIMHLPNMYEYKLHRLFSYEPLSEEKAFRGHIAIPRVLNLYENYPFWFTVFTTLGFRVVLSPVSDKKIYEGGMDSISSDTACYPAKIVHGHIKALVEQGEKYIFYPSINYEYQEDKESPNHYNCPIVATYPEVIANNMHDIFEENGVEFHHPFLPYDRDDRMIDRLYDEFKSKGVSRREVKNAIILGRKEQLKFKKDIENKGRLVLKYAKEHNRKAIILSGRPYHLDPEINHGIDKLITSYGFVVLTEDSVSGLKKLKRPIRVLDQWAYHSRLYKAANFASTEEGVELVQLNSFGCGVDAITTDQVEELLRNANKLYTVIKIDEGSNIGAIRIRIRSLKAALEERDKTGISKDIHEPHPYRRKLFTEKMREDYTIIAPQMSPLHFDYIIESIRSSGYKIRLVPEDDGTAVLEGLKYVNNDACYPTLVTVGKMIAELKYGDYDPDKTALIMAQTGGGCRCSNYVSLIRKALTDLKMEQIPVISFNSGILERNPGFKISLKMALKMTMAAMYGDLFQRCIYRVRPYEVNKGDAETVKDRWNERILRNCANGNVFEFWRNTRKIVREFDRIELNGVKKPKVGIVGEILVKYHPDANNHIVDIVEQEGGEAVVLEMVDFFVYTFMNHEYNMKKLSGTFKSYIVNELGYKFVYFLRRPLSGALKRSKHFEAPVPLKKAVKDSEHIASRGNQCGEGWLLTCEMVDLIRHGVDNIACLQPFGCLPNHVTGKGMFKAIRENYPKANIVAIDYDPGASNVNQLNRIKLMMSAAHSKLENA